GGGVLPMSCIVANIDMLGVFERGLNGSTFGGNQLASAVSVAALDVLIEESLTERANELGNYFIVEIQKVNNQIIKDVPGQGLLIGMQLTEQARPYCETLMEKGLLCKETHDNVIRFAPPLIIEKEELNWALERIKKVFA